MSKLRLIQAGMGGMGGHWWKSFTSKSPDFDLVAIVDVVEKPLNEAGDALSIPADRRFKSLEAALEKVQADAVLTVTPPAVHVEHARLAFSRGLHLMSEKPIADSLENAQTMVELARKAGRQLVITQNYRYRPFIQKMRTLLAENALGRFGHGHVDFYIPADFTGSFREKMEYVLLMDMAIHHMDLIRCVTGRNIRKVTAHTFRPPWSWYEHHCGLKMLLELDGGIPFSYSGDWAAKGRSTSWNGTWRLQCADGAMHLEDDRITLSRCGRWNKDPSLHPTDAGGMDRIEQAELLHQFAQAIRTGQPAETSGEDNLWSFGAVMAGVKSAKEGGTVEVATLIGS